jgi:hypothetical protein
MASNSQNIDAECLIEYIGTCIRDYCSMISTMAQADMCVVRLQPSYVDFLKELEALEAQLSECVDDEFMI